MELKYDINSQFYNIPFFSGIRSPTPIQKGCISRILAGEDCIGAAKTGSGKTFAFALPILQHLAEDPYGIFALVLTPTHELAYQVNLKYILPIFSNDIRFKLYQSINHQYSEFS